MPSAYGKRLKLRLFLEGVEVPVIAANVQAAPNSPVVASIQIPPLSEGTRFLPRTLVHLFFLDEQELAVPTFTERRNAGKKDPTAAQQVTPGEDTAQLTQYKLLFGGEMVGMVWNRTGANRALVLQCQDWSNYWDYAYQFNNTSIFGPGRKKLFSGGATNLFTDFLETKGNVITKIVASGRCNAFPYMKGLAAGIIRLMEAIGGTYFPNPRARVKKKKMSGQNLFFSIAELRLHITHMISAYEDDPTSLRLIRRQGWTGLFNRTLGGLGGQTSIRQAITALSRVMFYETYGQPCPMYVPGNDGSGTEQARVRLGETKEFAYLAKDALNLRRTAKNCLALLPDIRGATGTDWQEAVGGQTPAERRSTDVIIAEATTKAGRLIAAMSNGLWKLTTQAQARKAPARAQAILTQAATAISPLTPVPLTVSPKNIETLLTKDNLPTVEKALNEFIDAMSQIAGVRATGTTTQYPTPPRLNQQIYRPDIWFGAPIRCNVLFPDHYDYLTYQKHFLQEPTRFLLKTNDEFFGENFLFDSFYFSPQAPTMKGQKARMRDLMRGSLMDHELFTGILPVFEKMGEFNIFASTKKSPEYNDQGKRLDKEGFAQRSANFLYFKHRYSARQMTIGGRFNPYVACGCPGLIIDKYVDRVAMANYYALLAERGGPSIDISQVLGTNFLGNFTSVSHAVSAVDATSRTEVVCTYARQVEETVEFLGLEDGTKQVREKTGEYVKRVTDVASTYMPKVGALGPNRGKIVNVYDVTDSYPAGKELPTYDNKATPSAPINQALTISAETPYVQEYSPGFAPTEGGTSSESPYNLSTPTGGGTITTIYRAYRVEERVARYRVKEVPVPIEELLRPGWYGDIWTPGKIGQAYNTFFGTGAITDPQTSYVAVPNENMAVASEDADTAEAPDDPRASAPAATQLEEGASIQDAVDFLVLTYSYIKQNNLDVDAFASTYTWRPIATISDMFGTSNLEYNSDGSKVISGVEGIHSRAFGPYENLFGLVDPEIRNILGIKKDDVAAQKADTRKRKQDAVMQYAAALAFSRGILG